MYICITRKWPQTPINTRFFHVSQIAIYRYTDDLHIQREGKGERKEGQTEKKIQKGRPPHPYMECRWPPAKYLKRREEKKCYLLPGAQMSCICIFRCFSSSTVRRWTISSWTISPVLILRELRMLRPWEFSRSEGFSA